MSSDQQANNPAPETIEAWADLSRWERLIKAPRRPDRADLAWYGPPLPEDLRGFPAQRVRRVVYGLIIELSPTRDGWRFSAHSAWSGAKRIEQAASAGAEHPTPASAARAAFTALAVELERRRQQFDSERAGREN